MIEHILALVVLALASARLTRLLIFDTFPPAAWIRSKWDTKTEETSWNALLHCQYCLAPWTTLAAMLVGLAFGIEWWPEDTGRLWWFGFEWLGLSYVASMLVTYDGDD